MPCTSTYQTTVQWDQVKTDVKILGKALESMGFTNVHIDEKNNTLSANSDEYGRLTFRNGKMQITSSSYNSTIDERQLKLNYSKETVRSEVKRYGWRIVEKSPTQWEIQKGGYSNGGMR